VKDVISDRIWSLIEEREGVMIIWYERQREIDRERERESWRGGVGSEGERREAREDCDFKCGGERRETNGQEV